MDPRERSSWSEESLTTSENSSAMLDATSQFHDRTDYNPQSVAEVSKETTARKCERMYEVHPALPNPKTGMGSPEVEFKGKHVTSKPRSVSVGMQSDSRWGIPPAQLNEIGSRTGGGNGIRRAFTSPNISENQLCGSSDSKLHRVLEQCDNTPSTAAGGHLLRYPLTVLDSSSDQESSLIELNIDSDPLIEETTGLAGDSHVTAFFTPQGSFEDNSDDANETKYFSNEDSEVDKCNSLPLSTLTSRPVDHHILHHVRRTSNADLLST